MPGNPSGIDNFRMEAGVYWSQSVKDGLDASLLSMANGEHSLDDFWYRVILEAYGNGFRSGEFHYAGAKQIDWCAILVSPICKVAFPWFMNEVKDLAKFDDAKYRVVADGQIRRRFPEILETISKHKELKKRAEAMPYWFAISSYGPHYRVFRFDPGRNLVWPPRARPSLPDDYDAMVPKSKYQFNTLKLEGFRMFMSIACITINNLFQLDLLPASSLPPGFYDNLATYRNYVNFLPVEDFGADVNGQDPLMWPVIPPDIYNLGSSPSSSPSALKESPEYGTRAQQNLGANVTPSDRSLRPRNSTVPVRNATSARSAPARNGTLAATESVLCAPPSPQSQTDPAPKNLAVTSALADQSVSQPFNAHAINLEHALSGLERLHVQERATLSSQRPQQPRRPRIDVPSARDVSGSPINMSPLSATGISPVTRYSPRSSRAGSFSSTDGRPPFSRIGAVLGSCEYPSSFGRSESTIVQRSRPIPPVPPAPTYYVTSVIPESPPVDRSYVGPRASPQTPPNLPRTDGLPPRIGAREPEAPGAMNSFVSPTVVHQRRGTFRPGDSK